MKNYLSTSIFIFIVVLNFGQKNQFGIISALHLSSPNSISGTNYFQVDLNENSYSAIRGNLGAGYSFGLEFFTSLHEQIKFGISLSKFNGNDLLIYQSDKTGIKENLVGKMSQFRFSPTFKFEIPCNKITFSTESKLILPIGTTTIIENSTIVDSLALEIQQKEKITYNYSIGFEQNISFIKALNRNFSFEVGMGFSLFSQQLKFKETENYEENGVDKISTLSQYEKQTKYELNLNNYSNNPTFNSQIDQNKAKDELISSHNFSSINLFLSIKYTFQSKKSK